MFKKQKHELKNAYKHGMSGTRLHNIWWGIKNRCNNKKLACAKYYTEKKVIICDEWKNNFISFYNWSMENGYNDTLTIDRYPNKYGNYEPDNCRWVAMKEQNRNRCIFNKNKSGYTGVHLQIQKGKSPLWIASIRENGNHHQSSHKTKEEAIEARKQAELKYWGNNT